MGRNTVAFPGLAAGTMVLRFTSNHLLAAEAAATVTDASRATVNLPKVVNEQLVFQITEAQRTIPVDQFRNIDLLGPVGRLKITLVSGDVLEDTSTDTSKGEWELGVYSRTINKAKGVVFRHGDSNQKEPPLWHAPAEYVRMLSGAAAYDLRYKCEYTDLNNNWIPANN